MNLHGLLGQHGSYLRNRASQLTAALSLALAATSCSGGGQGQSQPGQGPPGVPVKVQIAQSAPVNETTEYVATLKSRDSAVIMPEVEGRITQIYVHSGDRVSAGTPLMQIDSRKQEATVNSQEQAREAQQANLAWAQQQYDRTNGLYKAGVVSKQDLDQAQTALDTARAQLQSLEAQVTQQQVQLHYYKVVAPRAGIVGDVPVRVGDRVITSTILTTVDQPGALEAYVYVPVERSAQLKLSMPVQIADASGNVLQSPRIPVLSVSTIGGQYFAFVAETQNGKIVAHQKLLHIGEMIGNDYVVLDGIKPGDKVIVSGTQFLVDGAPVLPQV